MLFWAIFFAEYHDTYGLSCPLRLLFLLAPERGLYCSSCRVTLWGGDVLVNCLCLSCNCMKLTQNRWRQNLLILLLSIERTSGSWPASDLSFWWFLNVSATLQERGTFRLFMCSIQNLSKGTAPLTSLSTAEALPVFDVLLLLLYKLCLLLHETHLDRFVPRWFEFIWLWLTVCFGDLSTQTDRSKTTPTEVCQGLDCTLRRPGKTGWLRLAYCKQTQQKRKEQIKVLDFGETKTIPGNGYQRIVN